MGIQHGVGLVFLGLVWTGNALLGGMLLIAPARVAAILGRDPQRTRQWLFLAGAFILGNTVMGVVASLLATVGMHQLLGDLSGGFGPRTP